MKSGYCIAMAGIVACFAFAACKSMPPQSPPPAPVFSSAKLTAIDHSITNAIHAHKTPGGVFWLERNGQSYRRGYGNRALTPAAEPISEDTIFDAASLTKVLATTPAIMLLAERGRLNIDDPVQQHIPEFTGDRKDQVTIRHLLTHTSGLRPGISLSPKWTGYAKGIELAAAEKLLAAPGTIFRYSDINFILLGEIVRRVSGQPLDQFTQQEIYRPLKMTDTTFRPGTASLARIAPTELVEGAILRGQVHDPTARRMDGVAGHAGLFTTAADVARFARMLLNEGSVENVRLFKPGTVQLMTRVHTSDSVPARRGLGWDIDSGYSRPRGRHFPLGSFGHTGFTGTSVWIDPFSKTFWIFLSNRVHPDGKGNILALQSQLGSLAAEAILGFNFAGVENALPPRPEPPKPTARTHPHTNVLNGIDVLVQQQFAPLKNLRVGLITNHTGTDRYRNSTIDLLHTAPGVMLKALFSPEHGIRGVLDEKVPDGTDEKTGLPIYSLYGESRSPRSEQLRDLDALVFDIQDIGCRFYTYISTMGNCMEAAGKANLKFFVLDRVNPINGIDIDGPVLNSATSFIAFHPIPVRHAMTVGELARMFNAERSFNADLTVIPLQGWSRNLWFDQTGLPWINPSPNMRSLTQAALYPGVGLLETTALSVGRGTDTPFEVIGAPYIDDLKLAAELNQLQLPGVRFVPIRFTPNASVFKGKPCAGVNIILTDRDRCPVIEIGLSIARILHRDYPNEFDIEKFNNLLGHSSTVEALKSNKKNPDIRQSWKIDLDEFKRRRTAYLLY